MKMNRIKWKETPIYIPPSYYGEDASKDKEKNIGAGVSEDAIFNALEEAVVFDAIKQENTKTSFNMIISEEMNINTDDTEFSNAIKEDKSDINDYENEKFETDEVNIDMDQYLEDDNEIKVVESFEPVLITYADEEDQIIQDDENMFEFVNDPEDDMIDNSEDCPKDDNFGDVKDAEEDTEEIKEYDDEYAEDDNNENTYEDNYENDKSDDTDNEALGKKKCKKHSKKRDLYTMSKYMYLPNSFELLEKMYDIYKKTKQ